MKRDSFPEELKKHRELHQLSQEELATQLANSHRIFDGVNQVMISKWERGDSNTSFLRRLGLANYFGQQYEFDAKEMEVISPSIKLSDIPINQNLAYSYTVESVDRYNMTSIPADLWQDILLVHSKLYSLDFLTFYKADYLSIDNIVILSFCCKGLMVGHIVYDSKTDMLLSIGSISLSVRQQILQYLAEFMTKKSLIIPVHDPAMAQFLYDLYLQPKKAAFGLLLYKVDSLNLVSNPFYQYLSEESGQQLKYLRYFNQKAKKQSIEYLF